MTKLSAAGDRVLGTFSFHDVLLTSIAIDASDNIFVAGTTTNNEPASDIFVGKLNLAGGAFAYTTEFGGSGRDLAHGLAVDPAGGAVVVGQTISSDFPTTADAFQPCLGGDYDGFVVLLTASGAIRWPTRSSL